MAFRFMRAQLLTRSSNFDDIDDVEKLLAGGFQIHSRSRVKLLHLPALASKLVLRQTFRPPQFGCSRSKIQNFIFYSTLFLKNLQTVLGHPDRFCSSWIQILDVNIAEWTLHQKRACAILGEVPSPVINFMRERANNLICVAQKSHRDLTDRFKMGISQFHW